MRDVPLSVIASWPTPNYVNPVTNATSIVICTAVCIPIITIVVLLRVYTRACIVKYVLRISGVVRTMADNDRAFGIDDWLIIPAAVRLEPNQSFLQTHARSDLCNRLQELATALLLFSVYNMAIILISGTFRFPI